MKIPIRSVLIAVPFLCFAAVLNTQAVVPPPDGGYPGGNTAEGQNAMLSLTTGGFNTAVGFLSLRNNTTSSFNTAIGAGTLLANTGEENTATGTGALLSNTIGFENTANGAFALIGNTTGTQNTAYGDRALFSNTMGGANTAIGVQALGSNVSGLLNTACGSGALSRSTGQTNTALGVSAGFDVTTADNVICIGYNVLGANISNSCYIGNIYSNIQPVVGIDPDYVTIDSSGRLGRSNVNGSSRRYKHDIKPMEKASEVLFGLKPVSFRFNKEYDAAQRLAFGLIAEEVAEVAPYLVGRNRDGEPESVRYEQINAMLLNEFLKEHRKNEKQEATIEALKKEIADLTSMVKEQAAQIEKVSASVEAGAARQVASRE